MIKNADLSRLVPVWPKLYANLSSCREWKYKRLISGVNNYPLTGRLFNPASVMTDLGQNQVKLTPSEKIWDLSRLVFSAFWLIGDHRSSNALKTDIEKFQICHIWCHSGLIVAPICHL